MFYSLNGTVFVDESVLTSDLARAFPTHPLQTVQATVHLPPHLLPNTQKLRVKHQAVMNLRQPHRYLLHTAGKTLTEEHVV